MNRGWTYTDRIGTTGETVLGYYMQRYRHSTEAEWRSRILQGLILLEGKPVGAQQVLSAGETLTYRRLPWQEPTVPLNFEVLYEDADLWAIAKPAGLPVLPGGKFLENTLLWVMRSHYPNEQPTPVHRLGRGTSGVMLVAKSQQAKSHLSEQFRARTLSSTKLSSTEPSSTKLPSTKRSSTSPMKKVYRALIGPTNSANLAEYFYCNYAIGKIPYPQLGYVYGHKADGLAAHSRGQVLARKTDSTLVEVTISTGRPHQIRIHLAAAGYPLIGDPLYGVGGLPKTGGRAIPSDCGYHLHAHRLQFVHPKTGETQSVTAALPESLAC